MSERDLARALDELRARDCGDSMPPEGLEDILEILHADEHASSHVTDNADVLSRSRRTRNPAWVRKPRGSRH